ncbi:hypothetical protein KM043_013184 [Ampulex compressa]|nr:hypothetical protein KM043_013184 [Ampulex compressa]
MSVTYSPRCAEKEARGSEARERVDAEAASLAKMESLIHKGEPDIQNVEYIKLPAFWKNFPELWFTQTGATFANRRILSDLRKYNYVLEALNPETVQQMSDLLRRPG